MNIAKDSRQAKRIIRLADDFLAEHDAAWNTNRFRLTFEAFAKTHRLSTELEQRLRTYLVYQGIIAA